MGVKNNFSQAVSELMGISRNPEPEQKKEAIADELKPAAEAEAEEVAVKEMATENQSVQGNTESKRIMVQASNPKERIMAMLAQQQQQQTQSQIAEDQLKEQDLQEQEIPEPQVPETKSQVSETKPQAAEIKPQVPETKPQNTTVRPQAQLSNEPAGVTTIAKGTVIIGEINAEGDVELLGSVKGKVTSQGDIKVNGKVIGDLAGRDIELTACAIQGNITATGMVTVDGDSVVIGDVKGENFCLDGKIKGNVIVEKEAKFQPKAILAGNVTTASIAMSQGAKIQGEVNIPMSEKETNLSFDVDFVI